MTLLITAVVLFVLTIGMAFLAVKLDESYEYDDWAVLPGGLAILFGCFLFFHLLFCIGIGYDYRQLETKRMSMQKTLDEARVNGRELEAASILRDVTTFNAELASLKLKNSTFLLGQYVDDRVDTLQPIQ